jgi:hypothetical protein
MLVVACAVTSLILAIALWLCRIRLARARSRTGDPVDYGSIPGTQMFDAELTAVAPSEQHEVSEPTAPVDS